MRRRHDSLIPLAHDHHPALVVAIALKKAGKDDIQAQLAALGALTAEWNSRLQRHFADEERLLRPLLVPDEWSRLTSDHEALRRAAASAGRQLERGLPEDGFCETTGATLERHIRWEDRELFDRIEARATHEQLEALARETSRR